MEDEEEDVEEGGIEVDESEERRSNSRLLLALPLAFGLLWGSGSLLHFGKVSPGSGLGCLGLPPGAVPPPSLHPAAPNST